MFIIFSKSIYKKPFIKCQRFDNKYKNMQLTTISSNLIPSFKSSSSVKAKSILFTSSKSSISTKSSERPSKLQKQLSFVSQLNQELQALKNKFKKEEMCYTNSNQFFKEYVSSKEYVCCPFKICVIDQAEYVQINTHSSKLQEFFQIKGIMDFQQKYRKIIWRSQNLGKCGVSCWHDCFQICTDCQETEGISSLVKLIFQPLAYMSIFPVMCYNGFKCLIDQCYASRCRLRILNRVYKRYALKLSKLKLPY